MQTSQDVAFGASPLSPPWPATSHGPKPRSITGWGCWFSGQGSHARCVQKVKHNRTMHLPTGWIPGEERPGAGGIPVRGQGSPGKGVAWHPALQAGRCCGWNQAESGRAVGSPGGPEGRGGADGAWVPAVWPRGDIYEWSVPPGPTRCSCFYTHPGLQIQDRWGPSA